MSILIYVKYKNKNKYSNKTLKTAYKYYSFTEIYNYQNIKSIYCNNNQLTELPELPPYLEDIDCSNNCLTSLPKLPESLLAISCWGNKLTSLPKLPNSILILNCWGNKISSLPELPDSLEDIYYDETKNLNYVYLIKII